MAAVADFTLILKTLRAHDVEFIVVDEVVEQKIRIELVKPTKRPPIRVGIEV